MADFGSIRTGPSELYLKLLKGEITPEQYARVAKKRVEDEARERPTATGAKLKRT